MSHEFRTPLNAILGYTSMLLKGVSGEMTAQQKRNLERIDSNSQHLLSIINDILDITPHRGGQDAAARWPSSRSPSCCARSWPRWSRSSPARGSRCPPSWPSELPTVRQRPAEGQADRHQSADQRAQVHAAGLGQGGRHVGRRQRAGRHRGDRQRHRHRQEGPGRDLRGLPPGRQLADPASTRAPAWGWRSAAGWPRCSTASWRCVAHWARARPSR